MLTGRTRWIQSTYYVGYSVGIVSRNISQILSIWIMESTNKQMISVEHDIYNRSKKGYYDMQLEYVLSSNSIR